MGFPITMIIHLELTISNIISRFFFRLGGLEVWWFLDQTLLDFRNQILVLKVSPEPGAWVKHIILKVNKPTTSSSLGKSQTLPVILLFPFKKKSKGFQKKIQRLGRFWWSPVDRIPGERITTISELVIIDHDFWGHWFYKYLSMQSTPRQIHMENHGFQRNIIYKWYVFHTIPMLTHWMRNWQRLRDHRHVTPKEAEPRVGGPRIELLMVRIVGNPLGNPPMAQLYYPLVI